MRGSTAVLERSLGVDSRRASGELDWRRAITLNSGVRFEPFTLIRGDAYNIANSPLGEGSRTRGYATAGVDLSWPLFRPIPTGSLIVEPLAQLLVSNKSDDDAMIPNEDSISFEFDETTLCRAESLPGFDRFEGGVRMNTGLRVTAQWGMERFASMMVGRSFRAEEDDALPARSGLRERASDWIVAATARPLETVFFRTRARLDAEDLEVRRMENTVSAGWRGAFIAINHVKDSDDIRGEARNEVEADGVLPIPFSRRRLALLSGASVDLRTDTWRRGYLGVRRDECTTLEVLYERENTFVRTLGPSDIHRVRLTLAHIGRRTDR